MIHQIRQQGRLAAVLAGWLLAALGLASVSQPQTRKPVPTAEGQGKAQAVIRSIFKAKYGKAQDSTAARRDLAQTLLDEGKRTTDDDDLRFVALRESRDLAARAGDLTLAFQAAGELASGYAVDLPAMKLDLLKLAARTLTETADQRQLARRLLTVVFEATDQDHYEVAKTAVRLALELANKTGPADLVTEAQHQGKVVDQQRVAFEKVTPALKQLQKKPGDSDAHLTVGKYLCFTKGRWTEGLRHLLKGSDVGLRTLAEKEASAEGDPPTDSGKVLVLGDGWWDRASLQGPGAAGQLHLRAYRWYKIALPLLGGLDRARIQQRIDQVLEEFPFLASGLLRTLEGHQREVISVAITPDGKLALSASWDKTVRVWDIRKGKEIGRFQSHKDEVNCVAVSPDGKYAASAGVEKTILVWDVQTRLLVYTLVGHTGAVRTVAFSPDSTLLLSGGIDKSLRLWDMNTGLLVHTLANAHRKSTESAVFSADGRFILSGSWDHELTIWDAVTRKALRTMKGHTDGIYRVALTPDARTAVSVSQDKTIRIWNVETATELHKLTGHADDVIGLAILPDGKRLLSGGGSKDKSLRLWDIETGKQLAKYEGHQEGVWSIAVAPNGWRAVTGGEDHTLRVWGLPKEE